MSFVFKVPQQTYALLKVRTDLDQAPKLKDCGAMHRSEHSSPFGARAQKSGQDIDSGYSPKKQTVPD